MSFGYTTIFKLIMAINVEHLGFAISPIISSHDVKVDLIFNLAQSFSILSVYHWYIPALCLFGNQYITNKCLKIDETHKLQKYLFYVHKCYFDTEQTAFSCRDDVNINAVIIRGVLFYT